ncbi:hypothetical protein N0V88_001460 [Collariella sp. IMI 366227]|nr:hypothetical protein N0V88_001460 [Collariella sp. IMI 366227]
MAATTPSTASSASDRTRTPSCALEALNTDTLLAILSASNSVGDLAAFIHASPIIYGSFLLAKAAILRFNGEDFANRLTSATDEYRHLRLLPDDSEILWKWLAGLQVDTVVKMVRLARAALYFADLIQYLKDTLGGPYGWAMSFVERSRIAQALLRYQIKVNMYGGYLWEPMGRSYDFFILTVLPLFEPWELEQTAEMDLFLSILCTALCHYEKTPDGKPIPHSFSRVNHFYSLYYSNLEAFRAKLIEFYSRPSEQQGPATRSTWAHFIITDPHLPAEGADISLAPIMEAKPEHEGLYRRAAADPQSISRAERNAIWNHPPPEDEDRLCVAKTGCTRAELLAKALANPEQLTHLETKILCDYRGVNYDMPKYGTFDERLEELGLNILRQPTPLEKVRNEAVERLWAIRSIEEVNAMANANAILFAFQKTEMEARHQELRDMDKARLLKIDGAECWGFVVFRTGCYHGDEAEAVWQRFRDHLLKVAEVSVLHWYSGPELRPSLRVFFAEGKDLEGATNEELRARFRKMRDGTGDDNLPKGIRTNCFLVADESVIKSEATQAPYMPRYTNDLEGEVRILDEDPVVYIRAVDPNYGAPASPAGKSTEDETVKIPSARVIPASNRSSSAAPGDADTLAKEQRKEMAHFKGEAIVALPRVFDWLHYVCFFAERGATPTLDARIYETPF